MRHFSVIAKPLITAVAPLLLLVHIQPVGHLAEAVARGAVAGAELENMRVQLIADAAALLMLCAAAALSVRRRTG